MTIALLVTVSIVAFMKLTLYQNCHDSLLYNFISYNAYLESESESQLYIE